MLNQKFRHYQNTTSSSDKTLTLIFELKKKGYKIEQLFMVKSTLKKKKFFFFIFTKKKKKNKNIFLKKKKKKKKKKKYFCKKKKKRKYTKQIIGFF